MRIIVLRTLEEKKQGLQHLPWIPEQTLYVFEGVPEGIVFHSRNVPEPFDIAFLDDSFTVIGMARMQPPNDLVETPDGTAYVLEAKGGRMKTFGISVGNRLALL